MCLCLESAAVWLPYPWWAALFFMDRARCGPRAIRRVVPLKTFRPPLFDSPVFLARIAPPREPNESWGRYGFMEHGEAVRGNMAARNAMEQPPPTGGSRKFLTVQGTGTPDVSGIGSQRPGGFQPSWEAAFRKC